MPRRISILGSTGSIGRAALEVIQALGPGYAVAGLAARARWQPLAEQVRQFRPGMVGLTDPAAADALRACLNGAVEVIAGQEALPAVAALPDVDCVVHGVVGAAGLRATLAAVAAGKTVALANKESLVIAGSVVMPLAQRSGATIIPVDSEHSAVFQALRAGRREEIRRVFLTASGGALRDWPIERLAQATPEHALKHPTWNMGRKITIDSATMMNKALEIVEAHWLFGLRADQIEVLVHPQSIVHAVVEFADGSLIAQMGAPDMRTPIQYALTWPERAPAPAPALDLAASPLTFQRPSPSRYPALALGYEVIERGGTSGAVLNAANEAAVQAFCDGRIRFPEIVELVRDVLHRHDVRTEPTLEDLLAADAWARQEVARCTSPNPSC